jgi:hypothetical protein
MRKIVFLFAFIFFTVLNCSAQNDLCFPGRFSETTCFAYENIYATRDVVYGYSYDPFTDSTIALQMDIYYPDMALDTMTKRPFILLVHGGSFLAGDRHDMDYYCGQFAERGFVCATIDYRLGWNCPPQTNACVSCLADSDNLKTATYMAVQDVRAALRFVGSNAAGWNVDPNYFFVGGASAGSIASFLAVLWTQSEANSFAPNAEGLAGKLDTAGNAFPKKYIIRGILDNCGAIPADSSLVNQLSVPVISFHDEFDNTVPYTSGTLFNCSSSAFYKCYGPQFIYNGLFTHGTCSELNTVLNSTSHCTYPAETIVTRSACFFKRILCNGCYSDTNTNIHATPSCGSLGNTTVFGVDNFSVSLSPSPGNDIVTLNFSEHCRSYGTIKFYNSLGIELFEQPFPYMTKKIDLDVSHLPSGMYFLVFDYPEKIPPMKMLVTHY